MTLTVRPANWLSMAFLLDRGVSDEARRVRRIFEHYDSGAPSVTFGLMQDALTKALKDAVAEAQQNDWDGYKAVAADPSALSYAALFLSKLPNTTPLPEIAVDTDGDIAIEWDHGPRQVLSVRVARDGSINFASLIGHSSTHGNHIFREDIPDAVAVEIERVNTPA